MFGDEVSVEQDRLDIGQDRVEAVQMLPARLDEADPLVAEQVGERRPEEVGRRDEIGVEDGDERRLGGCEPGRQRPRLEAPAVGPGQSPNIEPGGRAFGRHPLDDGAGVVGRIVEHLHRQARLRVVERRHRADEALHHIALVEDRKLHQHRRRFPLEQRGAADAQPLRPRRRPLPVANEAVEQPEAMRPEEGEEQQHGEVGGQHRVGEEHEGELCLPRGPARR